jgi:hypothetical protein
MDPRDTAHLKFHLERAAYAMLENTELNTDRRTVEYHVQRLSEEFAIVTAQYLMDCLTDMVANDEP